MSVIRLDSRAGPHNRRAPVRNYTAVPARGEQNGVWPDCGTELSPSELQIMREDNRFKDVLWEGVRAVAISVGMAVLLMVALNLLNVQ